MTGETPAPLRAAMTPQFPRIFFWHIVRNVQRQPLLALLNVLSVGLGIAVYLAIQIANHSANQSFAAGIDLVAGKAHLEVRGDVDETLWPVLAKQPGVRAMTGLVEGVVTLPDYPGEYLRVLGIDIFTSEPFRTFELGRAGERLALDPWLGTGDGLAVTAEFARRAGRSIGDSLRVLVNGEVKTLTILSLIDAKDSAAESQSRFAAMDIGWAQELFGKTGHLTSLQIQLDDPRRGAAIAQQLRSVLPANLHAEPPRQRSFQIQTMLSAFQLNLTALSMVSLLVGVFLIYNSISASVARRRVEIGILRAVGATRLEVRCLFLGEAALFGVLGIAAGLLGGVALAQVLAGTVAKTISSHYLLVRIEHAALSPAHFATAAAFGFAAVLIGAWMPANEAARIDPVGALSLGAHAERSVERAHRWGWLGVVLLAGAGAAAWAALRFGPPALGFAAAFFILAGFAFFAPGATRAFGVAAGLRIRAGLIWRLAADNLHRSIHRNAVTVAALAAAIALLVGLTIMIFSFRESVNAWVERGIVADLFIAPSSNEIIGLDAAVPPPAIAWLRQRPEVEAVDTFREIDVPLRLRGHAPASALLAVVQGAYRHNLTFDGGGDARKMARVFHDGGVAVTESFARKFGVGEGDRVTLLTPRGPADLEVAGVYSDYTRDQGVMLIERGTYARFWNDTAVQSLSVYLRHGAAAEPVAEAFRAAFSRAGEFVIYSNRSLRTRIFAIFDQTFAVTYVLRTVAIIVAIAGIFLSVTALVAERERDIGVLRAIGASRGQIQRLFMAESGMIGIVSTMLGMAAGVVLAMALTWVVNPAFFGWSIQLQFPWVTLAATPLWIVPATLVAAWYPAWRASRTPIAEAVREE
ncbi:MAG: putative transport system permease protein [Chthoniobacter sp.]|jgi:putative ABC transport system permease protein|nr:putative transport system permease protein [Chthoniobacter sp.]